MTNNAASYCNRLYKWLLMIWPISPCTSRAAFVHSVLISATKVARISAPWPHVPSEIKINSSIPNVVPPERTVCHRLPHACLWQKMRAATQESSLGNFHRPPILSKHFSFICGLDRRFLCRLYGG